MGFTAQDLAGRPMQRVMHARLAKGGYLVTSKSVDFPELTVSVMAERRGERAVRRIFVAGEPARDLQHAAALLYVARHRPFDADEPSAELEEDAA